MLAFLQYLLEEGLAFSPIKVYAFRLAKQAVMVDRSSAIHWSRDTCVGLDVLGLFHAC